MNIHVNNTGRQDALIGTSSAEATAATNQTGQTAGTGEANLTIGRAVETGNFAGIAQALGLKAPEKTDTDLMTLLQQMRTKVDNAQLKTSEQDIQNTKTIKKHKAEERIDKLREAAKGPPKWVKGLKKFGEVGAYVAASALIVGGAICCVTGIGAVWGAPMMMAGVAMLGMAVATTIADQTGEENVMQKGMNKMIDGMAQGFELTGMPPEVARGMAMTTAFVAIGAAVIASGPSALITAPMVLPMVTGLIFTPENMKEMGASDKEAMIASITINAAVAVGTAIASMGVGIAATVASGGAAAAPIAAQAAMIAANVVAGLTSAATQMLSGSASIGEGVHNYETGRAEADAQEMKAMMVKLMAMLDAESERIAEIMKRVEEGAGVVMNVMSQEGQTMDRAMQAIGAQRSMA